MGLHNRKVVIIGAGFVGSSIAYALTLKNIAKEIVLIDIDPTKAEGEAFDIQHGIPSMGMSSVRTGSYDDCSDCDLIVITAGRNRRVGESRLDMINDNIKIFDSVIENLKPVYSRGVILVVSNPVDLLTYYCDLRMALPNGRVMGTGCILDTSRLIREIANYVGLSTEVIKCNIIGEHGDSQIPIWSKLSIAGVPMEEYCRLVDLKWNETIKNQIYNKVKNMGATIIADKGRTHFGIATCVCSIADAILNQRLTIASVSTSLQGEYGLTNVALSLPSIIGVNGVECRLMECLSENETQLLLSSAISLKKKIEILNTYEKKE